MFKMYPVNILFFPTQELVTIVKDLKGQLNEIKGTNHTRRFQTLRDELKKYCHAIDFNETVALSKLRALIEEARLSKVEETAKITALLDRLTFSKQSGKQVDLRATIFRCLTTEAEIAADKLVRRYEQRGTSNRQASSYRVDRQRWTPDKAATLEAGDGATAIPTQSVTPVERAVISLATVINPHTENNHCQKNPRFSFGYLNLRFNKDQSF